MNENHQVPPFLEGYKFRKWPNKQVQGNYFHESTLVSSHQSAIRVTIEFPLATFWRNKFRGSPQNPRNPGNL